MISNIKHKIWGAAIFIGVMLLLLFTAFMIFKKKNEDNIDDDKMKKVDDLYKIWLRVASPSDKIALEVNKANYMKELHDKLTDEELDFMIEYSENYQTWKNESSLLTPTSITMSGYLIQNFNKMKNIAAKTSLMEFLSRFGVSIQSKMASIM